MQRPVAFQQSVGHWLNRGRKLCLIRIGVHLHRDHALYLVIIVVPLGIQHGTHVIHQIRIGHVLQFRRLEICLERAQHFFRVVHKIENVCCVLARMSSVQARQGLYRLYACQPLIHIHAAEQGLVEAGLEFIGNQQDLVFIRGEGFAHVAPPQVGIEHLAVLGVSVRA